MTWVRVLRRRMTPGFAPASTFKRPLNSGRAYSADAFCISNCASRNFKQAFLGNVSVAPTLPESAGGGAGFTSFDSSTMLNAFRSSPLVWQTSSITFLSP